MNVYRNEGLLQTFTETQANSGFGEAITFGVNSLGASIAISAPKMKREKQALGAVMSVEHLGKAEANSAPIKWHYGLQANSHFGASIAYIEYNLLIAAPTANNQDIKPQKPQAGSLYRAKQANIDSLISAQTANTRLASSIAVSDWQGDDNPDIALFNAGGKGVKASWQFIELPSL